MSSTVTFAGNLAKAPELLYTRENKPFVSCRVLVNRRTQSMPFALRRAIRLPRRRRWQLTSLNGPGREPAEGDYLIEWIQTNEERWRRD